MGLKSHKDKLAIFKYVSSGFCSNSEASASELLQNLDDMFPRYL